MLLINIKIQADKSIKSNNSRIVQDISAKIKLDLRFVVKTIV
jgi:hypothetical protein